MTLSSAKHDVFQAIADPSRRKMLRLLSSQEMPLNVIVGNFSMTRTAVSKHLRVLAEAGLVKELKVGRETRYSLEAEPLRELKDWLAFYEQFWNDRFDRLDEYLQQVAVKQQKRPIMNKPSQKGKK